MNNSHINNITNPDLIIAEEIRSSYIWVLVAVGLPANAACLVTVLFMNVTTATFYVALLAFADSVALIVKLVYHQLTITNASLCYSQHINNFCSCYANWVLVLITFQRFFAVSYPLKIKAVFTKMRIYLSAVVLAAGLFVTIVVPSFFLRKWLREKDDQKQKCKDLVEMRDFENFFLTPMYFFIPSTLIVAFIVLAVLELRRSRSVMLELQKDTNPVARGRCDERDASIMLVCAGMVFVVLAIPATVYHLSDPAPNIRSYLIFQVVTLLSDSSHAVNFFVYFFSASRFRIRFISLLWRLANFVTRGRCKHRQEISGSANGEASSDVTAERTHMASLN